MEGSDLLRTFESELRKSTEQIELLLLDIEHEQDMAIVLPALEEAYRYVHSIKGASRIVGLSSIEEMAHAIEDRMQKLVRNRKKPEPAEISAFLNVVAAFIKGFDAFLAGEAFDPEPWLRELSSIQSPASSAGESPAEDAEQAPARLENQRPAIRKQESVTISTNKIDELFRRVEEAFLIESRLNTLIADTHEAFFEGSVDPLTYWQKKHPQLQKEGKRLHFVLMQFHELIRQFRMVPASRMRVSLQKAVRDLAETLKKPVAFHFTGGEEIVDASLLDALQDPVVHIVRNAIDHGIESGKERKKKGKSQEGHISVTVETLAGILQITVTDDGAGIDVDKVRERALELALVGPEEIETWRDSDWLDVLFRPGFTTADSVSSISGRGMGMDIVRKRVVDMGGTVHVSSARGVGTTALIRVPIGLLTPRVLLVQCAGRQAALASSGIERVFPFRKSQAEVVNGQTLVRHNQLPVPVEHLAAHLGWSGPASTAGHVIVMEHLGTKKGLLVDEILGELEQVAFPPPWNLRGLRHLAGVIVMGSGTLVPVIETSSIVSKPKEPVPAASEIVSEPEAPATARRLVLVADDSPTILALHRSILKNAGYEVATADDGEAAWEVLQKMSVQLILTDLEMPRLNGLDLIRRIRKSNSLKGLPIIVVSQYGASSDLQKAAEAGADRYIVKSAFDPQRLLEMVREILE